MPRGYSEDSIEKFDPFQYLGTDLLVEVFKNLTPPHLLKASLVSKQWRLVASSDLIWQQICQERWNDKVYIPQILTTNTTDNNNQHPVASADQASASQSKYSNTAATSPNNNQSPLHATPTPTSLNVWKSTYLPSEFYRKQNITWKSRYLHSEFHRKRTAITMHELCNFEWKFRFKRTAGIWWNEVDPYWIHNKDESKMMRRRFTLNFKMISPKNDPLMTEETMSWRFVGADQIQVEDFPPLRIKRIGKNWGWMMENQWVMFIADLQMDGPHRFGAVEVDYNALSEWTTGE